MNLDHVFKKPNQHRRILNARKPEVPEGMLCRCNKCGKAIFAEEVRNGDYICPKCQGYFRLNAQERIRRISDEGTFEEWDADLIGGNPLNYPGYEEKIAASRVKSGQKEAVVTGSCKICGKQAVLGVMDGRFMMASMGQAVGEKITRAIERATKERFPVILFCCSGGARMQEGIFSLMQMAKTSAAIRRHQDAGLLYLSVLTDPTTGGVTASFAMEGDLILAEPKALIGFAGPRVIEQTIGQKLPKGFQSSEFLLEHGFVDQIVERKDLKQRLGYLLQLHCREEEDAKIQLKERCLKNVKIDSCEMRSETENPIQKNNPEQTTESQRQGVKERFRTSKTATLKNAWDRVLSARKKNRPTGKDYLEHLFPDFQELHGDRLFADDQALIGGIATFGGIPVTVLVQEKGTSTKESISHNFGMCSPEGYRKALRLMKQAEKFHRPVICLVDTPGAFCGIEAEERGQGEAIAGNLLELAGLKTPVLSVLIGEGGSGGALALAVANEVWMLENAIYSVLSPEGFASILWKDGKKAPKAAQCMKLTAKDLKGYGIVERIFEEPEIYTRETMTAVTVPLAEKIGEFLKNYGKMSGEELAEQRYERFRKM